MNLVLTPDEVKYLKELVSSDLTATSEILEYQEAAGDHAMLERIQRNNRLGFELLQRLG